MSAEDTPQDTELTAGWSPQKRPKREKKKMSEKMERILFCYIGCQKVYAVPRKHVPAWLFAVSPPRWDVPRVCADSPDFQKWAEEIDIEAWEAGGGSWVGRVGGIVWVAKGANGVGGDFASTLKGSKTLRKSTPASPQLVEETVWMVLQSGPADYEIVSAKSRWSPETQEWVHPVTGSMPIFRSREQASGYVARRIGAVIAEL